MKRKLVTMVAVTAACAAWVLPGAAAADEALPTKSDESCLKCHQYDKQAGLFAGKLTDVSNKAKTIQLQIGKEMEVIYFEDATVLKNAPAMNEIPKGESVRVVYHKKDGKNFAKEVEVKKGLKVPPEQLASVEEVAKLVALGPEKGKYVLLDGRPMDMYNAGHIPTAKGMPFFAFDDLKDKLLPEDKDVLQIYYCAGFS